MQVAVTGASGHVGSALVRELLERGHQVRAIARTDTRSLDGLPLEVRKLDVCDPDAVRDALAGMELVFHAAARLSLESGPDPLAEKTNVEGTKNVVAACRAHGVRRLVYFSSVHAMARDGSALVTQGQGRLYEVTKAMAEQHVLDGCGSGLDAVIVSPCAVLGPWDFKPSYIGRVLVMLSRGLVPMTMRGGQSWVDVRDVARSSVVAAERGACGARYVLGGHWLPIQEMTTRAAKIAGVRAPFYALPTGFGHTFAPMAERMSRWVGIEPLFTRAAVDALEHVERPLDPEAARVLGHTARPLEDTLVDTYAFFRERGMVKGES